jgi:AraC family transcriptional regulator, regulatory protein of adaptative response / methylated-DNA-[protein]-cysteine methyltransferase
MPAVSRPILRGMDPAPELNHPEDLLGAFPGLIGTTGPLKAAWVYTPIGGMIAVCSDAALHMLEFPVLARLDRQLRKLPAVMPGRTAITDLLQAELTAYFAGRSAAFSVALAPQGTPFEHRTWDTLQNVPYGGQSSYAEIARAIGRPTATRAMARANGANPIAILIPCHRILGTNGALTGYGGGLWRKEWLLAHEARRLREI